MENTVTYIGIAVSSVAALVFAYAMGLFSWKNHMPVEGKTILLTGASEGMGRSAALKLAARGANLVVVARNGQRLEELVTELKASAKNPQTQRFTSLTADISKEGFAAPLLDKATAWNNGRAPDIVWCVAGMATPGLFAESPFSVLRRNLDVNFYGTAELSHAVLRAWLAPDADADAKPNPNRTDAAATPKHLIMTSTVAALYPVAGYSLYIPGKAALRALADTLAQEVLLYPGRDVRVHVVYPGTITSPGYERENLTKPGITHELEDIDPVQTPDQCAEAAIRGLEAGQYFVTVAWLGHLMRWGALGGSVRNNWVVDTLMGLLTPLVFVFVIPDIFGKVKAYAKKHGHPSTYIKNVPS
ncbi:short chain dehydrogenase [Sodiomyces alkalinus F11]|uniref:3-dehydrosphinganine reductase n=1 Tax=Sodiomyces alkalinus (strain CBS 110278 / VKM F-3762 / F11) TaxID=1314773 RepID=A0A3N2PVH1_SODAK|nr:short chain dehydrogenase [Sodiomyces alkalinus F11]ROT38490.1 short chain dehydrogenase [Sodiomyces alkalinus F11]